MTSTVVFLGGAGLPEWIWDDARASVTGDTVVPEYPRGTARLDDYANSVREQVPDGDLVLVAHSIGGVVVPAVLTFAGTTPPEAAMRASFGPQLDDAVIDRLVADFQPESKHLYLDRTGIAMWPERCGYVLTTADKQVSPSSQRRYAKELSVATPVSIPSGHLPMLSHPTQFAEALVGFLG